MRNEKSKGFHAAARAMAFVRWLLAHAVINTEIHIGSWGYSSLTAHKSGENVWTITSTSTYCGRWEKDERWRIVSQEELLERAEENCLVIAGGSIGISYGVHDEHYEYVKARLYDDGSADPIFQAINNVTSVSWRRQLTAEEIKQVAGLLLQVTPDDREAYLDAAWTRVDATAKGARDKVIAAMAANKD